MIKRSMGRIGILVLLAFLSGALFRPAAVHARPDPRGTSFPLHGTARVPNGGNVLLSADIAITVVDNLTAVTYESVVIEGWLQLSPKGKGYAGTFTDNMANGKTYPATATGVSTRSTDGTYSLNTHQGRFTVVLTTVGGMTVMACTPPPKFGTLQCGIQGIAHVYNPPVTLTVTLGRSTFDGLPKSLGTLSIVTDAAHVIVPYSKKNGINSSFSYTTGSKAGFSPITLFGLAYPMDGNGGGLCP